MKSFFQRDIDEVDTLIVSTSPLALIHVFQYAVREVFDVVSVNVSKPCRNRFGELNKSSGIVRHVQIGNQIGVTSSPLANYLLSRKGGARHHDSRASLAAFNVFLDLMYKTVMNATWLKTIVSEI